MVFTSLNFLIFLPVVMLLFYITPVKYRWLTLLISSYFFYINIKPIYALLSGGITVSTYVFTRLIDKTPDDNKKRILMILNVIIILLPLLFFKYFAVINNELILLLDDWHLRWPLPEMRYILPIGISYYTFMCIGYTIDVYNEEIEAEKNIGIVALFVSFFPLILSGPIERAKNMLPQFRDFQRINYDDLVKGMQLMLWGFFMKLVVADRIAMYVDVVYGNIESYSGNSLLLAAILYPFQVYADLGGYSLIAIGVSKVLGIRVIDNFKRPFFATTMAEFWRRWHISLITWLTDYLYTPLSFSLRKWGLWGIILALELTFLISGIWHMASMTMVVWGLLQGTFLSIEAVTSKRRTKFEGKYSLSNKKWYMLLSMMFTFILFAISQVVGRVDTVGESWMVFRKIFSEWGSFYLDMTTLFYAFIGIVIIILKDFIDEFFPERINFFTNKRVWVRYSSYLTVAFVIILFGVLEGNSFIYFHF